MNFNTIPNNILVPFVAVEFDASRAQQGPGLLAYRALLIGQKIAAGTAVADTLQRVTNADQVRTLAGAGSQLHRMAKAYFDVNKNTETYIGVLADGGAAVAATGTLTVTGPATAAGTLSIYIGGQLVSVGVASGDANTAIATAISAAINAAADLPVTSSVSTGVVTVTAKNKGLAGNDIDLRLNYQDGERTPAGVGVAVVAMASGATNPTLSGLISAMGDTWFQVIAHPYTDATSLTALETELASRWGPMRQIDGVAITSASGTQATLGTLGDTRNSALSLIVSQPGKKPVVPPAEFAAATAAAVALEGNKDPARPLQTVPLPGVKPPAEGDRFTLQERNLLLADGIATTKVGAGGLVQLERLVTTYQFNAAGAPDTAYRDLTTVLTLLYLRYTFRTGVMTKYPRHKLANDGTQFGPGQPVITPKLGKAEAIGWFRDMEREGLVENFEQFKRDLVVERSATDPNRLEWLLPPDLINGFIVGAASIQFRL